MPSAFADYDTKAGSTFQVTGRAAAGVAEDLDFASGAAARIFTGATMPKGLDTVVMQEDVDAAEHDGEITVTIPPGLKAGANCRLAGEDTKVGDVVLRPGQRLRPQDLATAAAAGLPKLKCYARLKVAICSTGDEIIRPGEPLELGQVYDANAPMLRGLIEATGAQCDDLGILSDEAERVERALADAAAQYDVVITSGGASRGEEDHIVNAMDRLGRLNMWQIAIKPGRPMAFGQIGDSVMLGLPGNPVAVFVCFLLYVRPVLVRLSGGDWPEPVRYPLPAAFEVPKKKTGRREFWRGIPDPGRERHARGRKVRA